jgi:glyoxylase-like metal-dependent hydrolase (beta-lactamase superfamily II)
MSLTWSTAVVMRGGATRASIVLARRGADVALFDTGMAHHDQALLAALAAHGISASDVTGVFNTHAHVDHSHNNVLFERARIYCSARDRSWTREVHAVLAEVDYPSLEDIVPFYPDAAAGSYNPKLVRKVLGLEKLLWDPARLGPAEREIALEDAVLPPGISVLETPGHSPYHVSFAIDTDDGPLLVCGDALLLRNEHAYVAPRMPAWSEALYLESQARIAAFDGLIVPGHDEPFDNRR